MYRELSQPTVANDICTRIQGYCTSTVMIVSRTIAIYRNPVRTCSLFSIVVCSAFLIMPSACSPCGLYMYETSCCSS